MNHCPLFVQMTLKKYLYIYTSDTKLNVALAVSNLKKNNFFFRWNEMLRGYMDNGGYGTHCTVNCTVKMKCPSSNIALRKSNT